MRGLCVLIVPSGEAAYEKNVSTQQDQACSYPWFQGTHGNPGWPQGIECTSGQGSQAADGLTSAVKRHGFPRSLRLNRSGDFQPVFEQANRSADRYLTVLARANGAQKPRLGLAISRKQVADATDRNRIKRLVRESFRLNQHDLGGLDFIVMARQSAVQASREVLRYSLQKHWQNQVKQCKPF
jgi:ribonuclease P protein component